MRMNSSSASIAMLKVSFTAESMCNRSSRGFWNSAAAFILMPSPDVYIQLSSPLRQISKLNPKLYHRRSSFPKPKLALRRTLPSIGYKSDGPFPDRDNLCQLYPGHKVAKAMPNGCDVQRTSRGM